LKLFDVLIESEDSQNIWLALKLKSQGFKVGWVNPSQTYAAALYDPYFMGLFINEVTSQDFELLAKLYYMIKSPMGFSLVTTIGPIDYGNATLMDFYRFKSGMDAATFDAWLNRWVFELFANQWPKAQDSSRIIKVQGPFSYLYPKDIQLTTILSENNIPIIMSDHPVQYKKLCYFVGDVSSKVWVSSHRTTEEQGKFQTYDVWVRARIEVGDLWTQYPSLPGWTLWRNTEDTLPLYDSLFVLLRVFDDSRLADVYFKVPSQLDTSQHQMAVAKMIIHKLSLRLNVRKFKILNLEQTPYRVVLSNKKQEKVKQGYRGYFKNLAHLRPGWGIHQHLSFENQLASEISAYLKKMEVRGSYRD
jgi:hypothetical protein